MLGTVGDSQLRSIDQIESLRRTNPEIELGQFKWRNDNSFMYVGMETPPWNDIRVRQAMQMALDLETIVATYFKGYGDATPQGSIANDAPGFGTPFEEWPEEVKKTYRYDPAGAEKLLDEAGYTRGADGIRFKTQMAFSVREDASWAELATGYWREIGVEIEIDVLEQFWLIATPEQDTYRMTGMVSAKRYSLPASAMGRFDSGSNAKNTGLVDPEIDALIDAAMAATTLEEQQRLGKAANMYAIGQNFFITGPETQQFQAWQPWVKGFNGEMRLGDSAPQEVLARLWIDSELKKAMGH